MRLKGSGENQTGVHTAGEEIREQRATLLQPTPRHHVISLICSTCLLRLSDVNLKLQLHCWPSHWINYFQQKWGNCAVIGCSSVIYTGLCLITMLSQKGGFRPGGFSVPRRRFCSSLKLEAKFLPYTANQHFLENRPSTDYKCCGTLPKASVGKKEWIILKVKLDPL